MNSEATEQRGEGEELRDEGGKNDSNEQRRVRAVKRSSGGITGRE